ncbi:MAG: O-antigen ligase family protein [Anaerolineales bacterium]|nr:O-antigen ligase family protein [Anaerolineales bacterium]
MVQRAAFFWVWLAVLPFSMALFNNKLKVPVRAVLLMIALLTVYVVYVRQNDWKSGWVPVVIALAVTLVLYNWRFGAVMAVASLIPAAALAQRALASDTYSYSARLEAWTIIWEIIKVNPVLGLGPANYYYYTPLFPIRGYFVNFNSHSQYVDLVAQTGILGLIVFVWFFFEVGRVGWRLYRSKVSDPFARAYILAALGGFVATLVAGFLGDWVIPFFYNVAMYGFRSTMLSWVFLGGLVALATILKLAAPPSPNSDSRAPNKS